MGGVETRHGEETGGAACGRLRGYSRMGVRLTIGSPGFSRPKFPSNAYRFILTHCLSAVFRYHTPMSRAVSLPRISPYVAKLERQRRQIPIAKYLTPLDVAAS